MNKESEADVRSRRYKESAQMINKETKDDRFMIFSDVSKDSRFASAAKSILPPSNDFIGSRFIIASERDEKTKK